MASQCACRIACRAPASFPAVQRQQRPAAVSIRQPASSEARLEHLRRQSRSVVVGAQDAEMDSGAVENLNPMFNDQFSSVLAEALQRQGSASLFSGPIQSEPPRAEITPTALEQVLLAALQNSRRNLRQLEATQKAAADCFAREQKQFERLHFCLKKANSDAAYQRTVEQLLDEKRSELREYEEDR